MSAKPIVIVATAVAAAAGITALAAFTGWARGRCSTLGEADKSRLIAYVHAKYKIPASVPILVADNGTVGDACFHKPAFRAEGGARRFQLELFATPDFQFLTRELMDAKADPKVEQGQQRALVNGLTRGNPPAEGAEKAAATLVVFSDFQCPYCARMADILRGVMASERERARVLYHYFPLPMHRWARPVAEAAACAQEQGNQAFWNFHDFLFAHQGDLTADNLQQEVNEHAKTVAGFDAAKFAGCLGERRTAAQVETDLAFGNENGIHATPTVFLNGRQIDVVGPEQLHTLIRQLNADPNAVVPVSADSTSQ